MDMALLQLLIGEAGTLASKDQCHLVGRRLSNRLLPGLAGIELWPIQGAVARTGAEHQATISHRLLQGRHNTQVGQHIDRPGGQRGGAAASVKVDLCGDEKLGADIIMKAIKAPIKQIAENAGFDGGVVVHAVETASANTGFNAANGEYVDMFSAGIIDPVKVVRVALQNAVSVSSLLLTTEATISEIKEDKPAMPAMPGGGMGGMGDMY